MSWIGLDIGGANLKAALSDGTSKLIPFRFWIEKDQFDSALESLILSFPQCNISGVAATMTAELADCFDSRQDGVQFIVDTVCQVCQRLQLGEPIFASTDCEFRRAEEAKRDWLRTAAANWAMLARYSSKFLPDGTGVIVDMGSTTTDIIPVHNGIPVTIGRTDFERLKHGELVYAGSDRTPVCSVVDSLTIDGETVPIAREFFSTVADALLVLKRAEEDQFDHSTADGKPKTIPHASVRLCRMICEGAEEISATATESLAHQVIESLEQIVTAGIEQVFERTQPTHAVVTGSGKQLVAAMISQRFPAVQLVEMRGIEHASAPAFAVATLASEFSVYPS